jgi:tRNA(fMet)-specific endonuclease VapC
MAGRYVLDTNIVVALIRGESPVIQRLGASEEVFVPSIVLGELYYGAMHSSQISENLKRVEAFAAGRAILVCDKETARWSGELKTGLRAKGRPIPENDLWIAALARQHGAALYSRDQHFRVIEGIEVVVD